MARTCDSSTPIPSVLELCVRRTMHQMLHEALRLWKHLPLLPLALFTGLPNRKPQGCCDSSSSSKTSFIHESGLLLPFSLQPGVRCANRPVSPAPSFDAPTLLLRPAETAAMRTHSAYLTTQDEVRSSWVQGGSSPICLEPRLEKNPASLRKRGTQNL